MTVTVEQTLAWASDRKVGALVTLRKDGRAQTSDIVYAVIDGAFCISLTATRAKTANMRRDPRVVLHISDPDAWSYVSVDGTAELGPVATDPGDAAVDDLVSLYRVIAGSDHADWDEFRAAMVTEQRQVLRLRPVSVTGQINQ